MTDPQGLDAVRREELRKLIEVKPLEWQHFPSSNVRDEEWVASGACDYHAIVVADSTFRLLSPASASDRFTKLDEAKAAAQADYDRCIRSTISDTTLALLAHIAELEAGLAEAEEVVAKYWDAIDMMNDGPDDSDIAYAQGQIAEAHPRARPIAERYRAARAALLPKASVREERGRE